MSDMSDAQFDKADEILANALEAFIAQGVSQEVYGMALLEVGVLALVRLGEDDEKIQQITRDLIAKCRNGAPLFPEPRAS